MLFPIAGLRVPGLARSRRQTVAATPWWMEGGGTPRAAFAARGAASRSDSYINLVYPGVEDMIYTENVGWTAEDGWIFDALFSIFLETQLALDSDWSVFIKYNLSAAVTVFGSFDTGTGMFHLLQPVGVYGYWGNNGLATNTPAHLSGTYGIARYKMYRDGVLEANVIPAGGGQSTLPTYIGALNVDNVAAQFSTGSVSSFVAYDETYTLSDADAAAIMAAMP